MALVKTVRLNIITDPGTSKEKLDAIDEKARRLGELNPEIKVKVDTAAASLKLQVLRHELKQTSTETVGLGGRFSALLPVLGRVAGAGGAAGGLLALGSSAVALAGPLGAATIALGAFAAVAVPVFSKVEAAQKKLTAAQAAYAKAATPAGRASALKAEEAATKGLTGSQIEMMKTLQQLKGVFSGVGKALSPLLEALLKMVVVTAKDLVPALTVFAKAGGTVIMQFLVPFNKLLQSPLFAKFTDQISRFAVEAGAVVGPQLVKLLAVFMKLFIQVMPAGITILKQLLPALVSILVDLTPVIVAVAKITAVTLKWLEKNHLLVGAIGAVAIAIGVLMGASGIGAIILLINGVILVSVELYKHWGTIWGFIKRITMDVWQWIKDHWPLLLGILAGPIGIAVGIIVRHWHTIWNGAKAVWNWISSAWHHIEGWLEAPFKAAAHVIGGIFRTISGWIKTITGFFSSGGGAPGGGSSGGGVPGRYTGPGGSPQSIAAAMMPNYGWSSAQMGPLISLWNQESGWRWNATNPTSGAYGIPQSLPASKMASAGADWRTNPATQIRWGLGYIKGRYGSPGGAWSHEQQFNWYGNGLTDGLFTKPTLIGVGDRPGGEVVNVSPAGQRGGGGNTYNITLNVPPGANQRELGRQVVTVIQAYERGAGAGWRA